MDIKDLKVLVKMITETDITEFELESGEERIFLKRGSEPQVVQYQAAPRADVCCSAGTGGSTCCSSSGAAPAGSQLRRDGRQDPLPDRRHVLSCAGS